MNLSPDRKIAGVLAPLFALRGNDDLGIGDISTLREFIDWVADAGFKLVQLLPINEMGEDNSPYNAISAMAIEPTTLHLSPGSPPELVREDFETALADVDLPKLRHGVVKYRAVKDLKRRLLEKAFRNFIRAANEDRKSEFRKYCEKERAWLEEYTFFRALMEENGHSGAWDNWKQEHRNIESARAWRNNLPGERKQHFTQRQDFFGYVQWIANEQWRGIKTFAESREVALMGDIPFGVSYYSADVFARPGQFILDWCGGAPPEPYFKDDPFTQKWGQNWGFPLYRWPAMRANNFAWWRQRVRSVRSMFHLFRIDHILGFYRIYAFPWRPQSNNEFLHLDHQQMLHRTGGRAPHFAPRDDSNAANCRANQSEGEEYLRAILEEAGQGRMIGEDLGTVPIYVRPNLRSLGIAGFKIPQWEDYRGRVTPGSEYERISVATYATHDHKPMRKLWEEALEEATSTSQQARGELEKLATFSGFKRAAAEIDFEKDFYPRLMSALFQCNSWIAIVMITDLLARKYRFNVPGTAANSNWTRRMQRSISQLRSSPKEQKRMKLMRELLKQSGRA
jgi:4-alpha-glucanotransferase